MLNKADTKKGNHNLTPDFIEDPRLGIMVPRLRKDWEAYSTEEQHQILQLWEQVRGGIPDRIKAFERQIAVKQDQLGREDSFEESCRLNTDISELASRINDLNIWFRTG